MENRIYLCDIDGTLADNKHRNPFNEKEVLQDGPIIPVIEVITSLMNADIQIIFFSGRTEACKAQTIQWLRMWFNYADWEKDPEIYMRAIDDNRGDEIVKKELYDTHIKDKYEVVGVFDDRMKVCRMWYELGLFVFNVNQGLKEF